MTPIPTILFEGKETIKARALFVGERIDLRALEATRRLAISPLTVQAGENGYAVLRRYGVVVLLNLEPLEEVSFLTHVKSLLGEPFSEPEVEME